ncbi:hypothetical protein GQX74_014713 [Glossina fuscipes]|nr:hypothetical protein GQX74_014713 [Glossina fuscipes]
MFFQDEEPAPAEGAAAGAKEETTTAKAGVDVLFGIEETMLIAVWTLFCTIQILWPTFGRYFSSRYIHRN